MYTSDSNQNNFINTTKTNSYPVLNTKKSEPLRVVRQYVNPAVYIESSIYDMSPFKRSPLFVNYASDDEVYHKAIKVKRCSCLTNPNECPCHPTNDYVHTNGTMDYFSNSRINTARESSISQISLNTSDTVSTLKPANYNVQELKLSFTSLTSQTPSTCYMTSESLQQKEDAFRKWCARKAKEKRKQEEELSRLKEEKERERQKLLETERENFRRWLTNKKKEEEKRKKEQEQKLEEEKLKKEMKVKRSVENELRYQLWLKKKEEQHLEKQLKEQIDLIKRNEERQQRLEDSLRAYNDWLKYSKNKPKPIPLNQGLQSLRSAVSVTYVNPTPWIPNIDLSPKPASQ